MKNPITSHSIPQYWQSSFTQTTQIQLLLSTLEQSFIKEIEEHEFEKVLKQCNTKSAPGPSKITYKFWKKCCDQMKSYILALFNKSFLLDQLQKNWLESELILLPKPRDWEKNLNLTHPIILLEILWKLYIKILSNHLTSTIL